MIVRPWLLPVRRWSTSLVQWGNRAWRWSSPVATLPVPTVVVGNVVTGGAGKTPVVIWLAQSWRPRGSAPHVVMMGYRGALAGGGLRDYWPFPVRRVRPHDRAWLSGDEPLLMARMTQEPVWCGARLAAIGHAYKQHNAKAVIVDDGVQHPLLARAFSLLVLDAQVDLNQHSLIPMGIVREPLELALKRVQAVVVLGKSDPLAAMEEQLERSALPIFRGFLKSGAPQHLIQEKPLKKSTPLLAFAGIGRPQKFFDSLVELGYTLRDAVAYPDHYHYKLQDWQSLRLQAQNCGAVLATTAKDFVRLPAMKVQDTPAVVDLALRWYGNDGQKLLALLHDFAQGGHATGSTQG